MPEQYDIIVVGGGSSGAVVAGRMSEDPAVRVLLIEAGSSDRSPLIWMPKGHAKLVADPKHSYFYAAGRTGAAANGPPEIILRGRGLGGSSSINGMVYHRGQPEDYDEWANLGLSGWSWRDVLPAFMAIEDNRLPGTEWRGRGGPLPVRAAKTVPPLANAVVDAAGDLGLPYKEESNLPQQMGIGPVSENIDRLGRRVSSAAAFLTPSVRRRNNLRILTNCRIDRIIFRDKRAVGVSCTRGGKQQEYRAAKSVVLCTGTYETPRLLQLSGIGPADHLRSLGIDPVVDLPGVGQNYLDHFSYTACWRLKQPRDSENRDYSGIRLGLNVLKYYLLRKGPLSTGSTQLAIFPEVLAGKTGRADAEFVWAPWSLTTRPTQGGGTVPEDEPGCTFTGFPLRATSQGSVMIQSSDTSTQPTITPNYLSTEYDRAIMLGLVRFTKKVMAHESLKPFVDHELPATASLESDDEILEYVLRKGNSAQHGCGTCKMGADNDPMAVLDKRLTVRGVEGLRVADCSVMPLLVSANTNGPAMMIGWKLSEMLKQEMGA